MKNRNYEKPKISKSKYANNFFVDLYLVKARAAKSGVSTQKALTMMIEEGWQQLVKELGNKAEVAS